MIKKMRRKTGATISLIAICVLVILVIGIGIFSLIKLLGGGRELANTTDAGELNLAKQAIRNPGKDALTFPNTDVGTNFALLGESPRTLNLMVYNRLVAQSVLVALNAKDEATPAAATDAKRVWTALNDVGQFLRTKLEDPAYMSTFFSSASDANHTRMLNQSKNLVVLKDLEIAYMKKGQSTNIYIDPVVLATISSGSLVPLNKSGSPSPTGFNYLSGYSTISIPLSSGDTLDFSGVPVFPQNRPHLVSYTDFLLNRDEGFVTGKGSPSYPANTLPPNGFKSAGQTTEMKTNAFTAATACAIVGCLTQEYQMQIPYGYIEIKNGPSEPGPKGGLAATANDIYSHSLAGLGIDVSADRNWFCRGSDGERGDTKKQDTSFNKMSQVLGALDEMEKVSALAGGPGFSQLRTEINQAKNQIGAFDQNGNLIDRWVQVNSMNEIARQVLWKFNIPDRGVSLRYIRHGNGSSLSEDDLKTIGSSTNCNCHWKKDYTKAPRIEPCLNMLGAFRTGYSEFGSTAGSFNPNGYTALEQFKMDAMLARVMCTNCASAPPPKEPSGMKWFDHGKVYAAPKDPYNFGIVQTPYQYLQMIDKAPTADGCALGTTLDTLLKRCQQIKPSATAAELNTALNSQPLALNTTLYLDVESNTLTLSSKKPVSYVAATIADGTTPPVGAGCGKSYDVIHNYVATSSTPGNSKADPPTYQDSDGGTDGGMPGTSWGEADPARCTDQAIWTPSSGYNNLLGKLDFSNSCTGKGGFCQPN